MLHVRPERPDDHIAIDEIHEAAFGQINEARLVAELRKGDGFTPELSLVAVRSNQVVGHILFSPIHIATARADVHALALAPMAVRPELQGRGIGSELVRRGLDACHRLQHGIVIVVGHPHYYPRFGFTPARPHGLEAPFPVPDDAFMVRKICI